VFVELTDHLQESGLSISALAQSRVGEELLPNKNKSVRLEIAEGQSPLGLSLGLPFKGALRRITRANSISIVHSHGLWEAPCHWSVRFARKQGIPLIIQPRGTLMPWSLANKSQKKQLAMNLYQRRDLNYADLLMATSEEEYISLRKFGLKQPMAIVANGVDLDLVDPKGSWSDAVAAEQRTILFLSRIHPVKGLDNLIRAWAKVERDDWRLTIAGPVVDQEHFDSLKGLIERLDVGRSVTFQGELTGGAKSDAYRAAELFVLPSFTENFGVVVAEALAHGVPVITTKGTPWSSLLEHRCGWQVDIGVEPLVGALREAMALSDAKLREMGGRARQLAKRFDWSTVTRQVVEVYGWLLGHSRKPTCVRTD
jgi:glycosyltransferase involved in cell wall biosynthesis